MSGLCPLNNSPYASGGDSILDDCSINFSYFLWPKKNENLLQLKSLVCTLENLFA